MIFQTNVNHQKRKVTLSFLINDATVITSHWNSEQSTKRFRKKIFRFQEENVGDDDYDDDDKSTTHIKRQNTLHCAKWQRTKFDQPISQISSLCYCQRNHTKFTYIIFSVTINYEMSELNKNQKRNFLFFCLSERLKSDFSTWWEREWKLHTEFRPDQVDGSNSTISFQCLHKFIQRERTSKQWCVNTHKIKSHSTDRSDPRISTCIQASLVEYRHFFFVVHNTVWPFHLNSNGSADVWVWRAFFCISILEWYVHTEGVCVSGFACLCVNVNRFSVW